MSTRAALAVFVGAVLVTTSACSLVDGGHPRPVAEARHVVLPPRPTTSPTPTVPLVPWHGPVEQLFVHPLVVDPTKAFTNDRLGRGFIDYFVTAREFKAILQQLWQNKWTLVAAHRVADGTVRVPAGRKPLVLQEDDVNYYSYFTGRGLASRLTLDHGRLLAEVGSQLSTDDVVPLTDEFVAEHPEFSADGAKGVLAVTAYEGLFGEHNLSDPAARNRVRALADRLRATGWTIASHTYGHINLARDSLRVIATDTARWKAATKDVLGPVDILIYPFGAEPSIPAQQLLRVNGFRIQYDIDVHADRYLQAGVLIMSRRHVDGFAFDVPASMAQFFDVAAVRDPQRPR